MSRLADCFKRLEAIHGAGIRISTDCSRKSKCAAWATTLSTPDLDIRAIVEVERRLAETQGIKTK